MAATKNERRSFMRKPVCSHILLQQPKLHDFVCDSPAIARDVPTHPEVKKLISIWNSTYEDVGEHFYDIF